MDLNNLVLAFPLGNGRIKKTTCETHVDGHRIRRSVKLCGGVESHLQMQTCFPSRSAACLPGTEVFVGVGVGVFRKGDGKDKAMRFARSAFETLKTVFWLGQNLAGTSAPQITSGAYP